MERMRPCSISTVMLCSTRPWRVSTTLTLVNSRLSGSLACAETRVVRPRTAASRRMDDSRAGENAASTLGRGGQRVKQIQELQLFFRRQERRFEGIARQFAEMIVGEAERLLRQLVFAGKSRRDNRGIVAVQGNHETLIEVLADGVIGQSAAAPGTQVAGQADFHRDLAVSEFFDQFRILNRGESVTDAFGAQVERAPDGTRARGFSSMSRHVQTVIAGVGVDIAEKLRLGFALIASDAEGDDVTIAITDGEIDDRAGGLGAELADRIEHPHERDAEVAGTAFASALEALEDRVEILLAPQVDADRDVDLGVQDSFRFELFHQAIGDELVVGGGLEVFGDFLEGHQESGEVGVAVDGFNFFKRAELAMTGAEFEKGRRVDGAFEVEVEVGLGEGKHSLDFISTGALSFRFQPAPAGGRPGVTNPGMDGRRRPFSIALALAAEFAVVAAVE